MTSKKNLKKRKIELLRNNAFFFDKTLFQKTYSNPVTMTHTFFEPRYSQDKIGYAKVTVAETHPLNLMPLRAETHLESLNRAFQAHPNTYYVIPNLLDLKDELILLLLENISLDHRFHQLKFRFSDLGSVVNVDKIQFGVFISVMRVIEIKIHALAHYTSIAIHEMAHAMAYFMFRSKDDTQPSLYPFPQKGLYSKSKFSEEAINPAELKFRHCVREDKKRLERLNADRQKHTTWLLKLSLRYHYQAASPSKEEMMEIVLGPRLNVFFSAIECSYETKIQESVGLSEIFSFYIQYRMECLEYAALHNIAPSAVLHFLKNKL